MRDDISSFENTAIAGRIRALDSICDRIGRAQAEFLARAADHGARLACPESCGACCKNFIPDATPLEADKLALYLFIERPDLAERFASGAPDNENFTRGEADEAGCPFRDENNPGRDCTVYPARPLVCRFFGFCAMRNKAGEPTFTLCRAMPSPHPGRSRNYSGAKNLLDNFGAIPPSMTDFSLEIASIAPHESGDRQLITKLLPPALARLALAFRLSACKSPA